MVNRRHLLAVTALACLVLPSGASGDPLNTFTAAVAPTHVRPSTSVSIAITMTSAPLSSARAQRAKIGIPPGFVVDAGSVKATTGAVAGLCEASTWQADGELIADQKIHLTRTGNNANSLCPGATLTVAFNATSAPEDGTYAWTIELLREVDDVFTLTGAHPSVVVESIAPAVTFTQTPSNPSNAGSPSFAFTAAELASFECRLDAGDFQPCSSPRVIAGLVEGTHTFAVKATDAAGNTGSVRSYSWTLDTTPPTATITTKPSDPSNTSDPTFAFTAGEGGATFACKLDAAAFAPCSSPKSYADLAEISHTFVVKATDAAGNTGPEASYSWTIDTTPPIASITQHPANPSGVDDATFAFTANENGSTFSCRLDGAAFGPCTSPKGYANLADGAHTFTVRATDAAGNVGASVSYGWTIDTAAPIVAITQRPNDPTNNRTATFTFSSGDATAFQCRLDGATFASCTSPKTYTNLSEGSHTFAVRATDAIGNAGPATTDTWRIDLTAPTATIEAKPSNPSNDSSPTFLFSASENGTSFACRLEGGGFAPCSSPKDYAGLGDGLHSFGVRPTDAAGNVGPEASFAWAIDTTAPVATITAKPSSPSNSSSPSFSFTATEPGSTFVCSVDGAPFSLCASPAVYNNVADGPHTFGVKALDLAGNTGPEATHAWTIETGAPTAVLISAPSVLSNSSAATFAFSANEPASFDCSVDGRGFEPCTSPTTQYGLGDGGHAFTVRAKDAVGNLSAPVGHSWTIDTTAPETTLASGPRSGTSTSATFTFTATEGGIFECSLDGAPFVLCTSPRSYSGLARRQHRFEVRAIDAAGNADATPAGHTWSITTAVRRTSSSALLAPRAGARVTRPPLLVWRRAARASYYNVQLFRGRQKILSIWPARTRLQLRARWTFSGRQRRLTPGAYRWYVWPGYGSPSLRNYGPMLGQSSFVLARPSARR